MDKGKKKQRNSAIELLRIIAMLIIVASHFSVHGGFDFDTSVLSIPRLWLSLMPIGEIGVDVFVLISGYYLVTATGPILNVNRIFKLWFQIFFYSVSILLLFYCLGLVTPNLKMVIKSLFPIAGGAWWFASTYFVLYLIHPFLNVMLVNFDRRTYQAFLAILLILWCVIPTFLGFKYEYSNLTWFIAVYSLAGYVRLYGFNSKYTSIHYFKMWVGSHLFMYFCSISMIIIGTKLPTIGKYASHMYAYNSVFLVLASLFLFMAFLKLDMGYHKWINVIASGSFGVYLISDSNVVRPLLWKTIFHNASYQDSIMVIPYSIGVVILVYVVCTILDLIRKYTIEKAFMNAFGNSLDRATAYLENKFDSLDK